MQDLHHSDDVEVGNMITDAIDKAVQMAKNNAPKEEFYVHAADFLSRIVTIYGVDKSLVERATTNALMGLAYHARGKYVSEMRVALRDHLAAARGKPMQAYAICPPVPVESAVRAISTAYLVPSDGSSTDDCDVKACEEHLLSQGINPATFKHVGVGLPVLDPRDRAPSTVGGSVPVPPNKHERKQTKDALLNTISAVNMARVNSASHALSKAKELFILKDLDPEILTFAGLGDRVVDYQLHHPILTESEEAARCAQPSAPQPPSVVYISGDKRLGMLPDGDTVITVQGLELVARSVYVGAVAFAQTASHTSLIQGKGPLIAYWLFELMMPGASRHHYFVLAIWEQYSDIMKKLAKVDFTSNAVDDVRQTVKPAGQHLLAELEKVALSLCHLPPEVCYYLTVTWLINKLGQQWFFPLDGTFVNAPRAQFHVNSGERYAFLQNHRDDVVRFMEIDEAGLEQQQELLDHLSSALNCPRVSAKAIHKLINDVHNARAGKRHETLPPYLAPIM